MKLKPGPNRISFYVTTELRGTQEVSATIYLWEPDSRILVSDFDGTITKSDVMGQLMPLVGKDWSHSGVAPLFKDIKANGYKILYLTARAIGQAGQTKGYMKRLVLPEGPVLMSPDRLLQSFNREVIRRKPEEFKIAVLRDIQSLFPPGHKPFYAGFGNRQTDAISYRAVGIPLGKIFTINPRGEITTVNYTYKKTYPTMHALVDEMFPPLHKQQQESEDFNDFQYWRLPIPKLDFAN
jgi:phosphatidate phosphatase LPIN